MGCGGGFFLLLIDLLLNNLCSAYKRLNNCLPCLPMLPVEYDKIKFFFFLKKNEIKLRSRSPLYRLT